MKKAYKFFALFFSLFLIEKSFGFAYNANLTDLAGINDPIYDDNGELIDVDEILNGIGATVKRAGDATAAKKIAQVRKAVAITKKRANTQLVEQNTTPGQRYIVGKSKELPANIQVLIAQGKLRFTDSVLYHMFFGQSTLTNIVELMRTPNTASCIYSRGYSSFDEQGKMDSNMNVAVDFISLDYLENYTIASGVFSADFAAASSDSYLCGAELVIEQDSDEMLRIPIAAMVEDRIVNRGTGLIVPSGAGVNGFNLNQKLILKAGAKVQTKVAFPDGVTITTTTPNTTALALKVQFYGDGTINR